MSRSRSLALVLLSAFALGACSSSSGSSEPPAPAKGTATLRFSLSDSTRKSTSLMKPLKGTVYGAIYLAEDVAVTGPRPDATQVASVTVANVDLETAQTSAASWTSEPLEPNKYIFVGFLDLNGNGATKSDPDPGEPATVPLDDKKFDITENGKVDVVEAFDIVVN